VEVNMSEEIKDLKQELNEFDEEYVKLYEKYCNLRNEIKHLQQKVEQLENIRKEAIEYVETIQKSESNINPYILHAPTLLNILNKGSNKE
jgi:predicted nuclease with TOPRIM domain